MPWGLLNPVISAGFTVTPEVVYSPIVPSGAKAAFTSNMVSPRPVAGMVNTAAATESIASAHRVVVGTVAKVRRKECMAFLPSEQRVPGPAPVAAPLPVGIFPRLRGGVHHKSR